MADILYDFAVKAPGSKVFQAVSTWSGLDAWWTKRSSGEPKLRASYNLWFGPRYDWQAVVSRYIPQTEFELELTAAQEDWLGTRVGFTLEEKAGITEVHFQHLAWPAANAHYRGSCYCWAMYLRLLKRYVERGELVPYEDRLES